MSASTDPARPLRWARLTAPELRAALAQPCVGLWPIGSTEQHGPHLATGFDHLAAAVVADRAAAGLGAGALVLPFLPVGCSAHWMGFGATLTIGPDTMIAVIADVCRSASDAGLRDLVIVNGHAGNVGAGMAAAGSLPGLPCRVHFASYWDFMGDAAASVLTSDSGVGHAAELETSIGLSLGDPAELSAAGGPGDVGDLGSLIRPDQIPGPGAPYREPLGRVGVYRPVRVDPAGSSGVVGDPAAATRDRGQKLVELAVSGLEAYCRSLIETQATGGGR
jgi:creatinine amidohydrolase